MARKKFTDPALRVQYPRMKLIRTPNIRSIAEAGVVHHSSRQESTIENTLDDKELQAAHGESSKAMLIGPQAAHGESSKAMLIGPVAHAEAPQAKPDVILAETERFKSMSINETYSITECVTVLNEIADVTDDIYMKALEKFMDPGWREAFLAMPNDRRKGWLVRL